VQVAVFGTARRPHFSLAIISVTVQLWLQVFWVISIYFNIRNTLPKSGTFLFGHTVCLMGYRCLWTQWLLRMKDTRFHVVVNRNVAIKVKLKVSHYRLGRAERVLRKLRFPDFMTTVQDGGRLSALCNRKKKYRSTKERIAMPLPTQAQQAWDDLNSVAADADDYDSFSYGDVFQ